MPVNSFEDYPMSWTPRKPKDHTPLYKSFANQLEKDIISSKLAPNTQLPPQRELADYLDVNLSTITKAYRICEQKGLIYAATGKGTFVSPNALLYREHQSHQTTSVNLRSIEPFHNTDRYVEAAMKRILSRPNFHQYLSYQSEEVNAYHKLVGRNYLNSLNIPVSKDQVILTSGSQNALSITMLSLFNSGDKIAVDEYTYHHFKMLANFLGIRIFPVTNDNKGMLPDALDFLCSHNNIQGIYLMPSCSNPTAIEMPLDRRLQLRRVLQKHNLIIIEDDSYRYLSDLNQPSFFELLPMQTIYINSTSKSLCSGVRIAYMAFVQSFEYKLRNASSATNLHHSFIDAEIISELINSRVYKEIQIQKKELSKNYNECYNKIFEVTQGYTNPHSLFRWLKIQSNPEAFLSQLREEGIQVMESALFNAGTDQPHDFIRIALSSVSNDNILEKALLEIKQRNIC